MRSELESRKWFWGGVALQFATGYSVAFLVYQIGTLITEGTVGTGFVPGLVVIIAIAAVVISLIHKADKSMTVDTFLKK